MNKPRRIQEAFYVLMKVTFTQVLIIVALSSLVSAAHLDTNAQRLLERKVSLDINDQEIKQVLKTIEQQTAVVFTYSPKVIDTSKKISLNVNEAPAAGGVIFNPATLPSNDSITLVVRCFTSSSVCTDVAE